MTRYPEATWRPGPAGKVWPGQNSIDGIIEHSMQGSLAGAYTVLDDESVNAQGAYIAASWTFSVTREGQVFQHYELEQSPFHAGSKAQNLRLIGVEHEGGPPGNLSEPLTEPQTQASVKLANWIAQQGKFTLSREPATKTLYEHNEVTTTQCPSGRIPWDRYVQQGPPPLDLDVIGLNAATRYMGFSNPLGTYEYDFALLNTFGGDPNVGLNIGLEYIGYDVPSGEYRYRIHVLKHWSD